MVTITCYGGVGQIGGNQFLLEDGATRLLFDFGTPYGQWNRFYEEYLKPRPAAGLLDPLIMGLLPPLQGLYRAELEAYAPHLWERVKERQGYRTLEGVEGVLLSHAHLDHSGYITFLREEVPIYASAMTAFIAKAIQDTSGSDFEKEVCYYRPRQLRDGALKTSQEPLRQRPFVFADAPIVPAEAQAFWRRSPLKTGELTTTAPELPGDRVGGLPLRALAVNHSIYGATVFAVETSAGWVAFTGDLRLDWDDRKTEHLIDTLKGLRLRALLCEGTRAGEEGTSVTEAQVAQQAQQEARKASGLVIADFGPRNVHRLKTFLAVAQALGRKLVITAKDAYLLQAMASLEPDTPTAGRAGILVYQELKSSPPSWETELREHYRSSLIGPGELRANPEAFILCFSFWDMKELVDIEPRGGLYIYSSSEPYNEEQQMDVRRLKNWLNHFHIEHVGLPVETSSGEFEIPEEERGLHASGHSTGGEIIHFVKEIAPQMVIPVRVRRDNEIDGHQYFQEQLHSTGIKVAIPEYGIPLHLDQP